MALLLFWMLLLSILYIHAIFYCTIAQYNCLFCACTTSSSNWVETPPISSTLYCLTLVCRSINFGLAFRFKPACPRTRWRLRFKKGPSLGADGADRLKSVTIQHTLTLSQLPYLILSVSTLSSAFILSIFTTIKLFHCYTMQDT